VSAAAALALFVAPALVGVDSARALGAIPPELVVESNAVTATIGVVTRVPAESPGGSNYAATNINTTKARARAAAVFLGDLVDAFFESSSPSYNRPTQAHAQYPRSGTIGESSSFGSPSGSPSWTARASGEPMAEARAVGAAAGSSDGSTTAEGGVATARSRIDATGTVVTEIRSEASGIVIGGGAARIGAATSNVTVRTAPDATPKIDVDAEVSDVFVGGVRATLGPNGLRIADNSLVTPEQVSSFNAALSALEQAGITVLGPASSAGTAPGDAGVRGSAVRVRYDLSQYNQTPNAIGFDEEITFAPYEVSSVSRARPKLGLGGSVPLPPSRGAPTPASSGGVSEAPQFGAQSPVSEVAAPAAADRPFMLHAAGERRVVGRFRGLYVMFIVIAAIGAAVVTWIHRIQTT
jgi:hypothetical protein